VDAASIYIRYCWAFADEDYSPCASGKKTTRYPTATAGARVLYHYDDISSADAPPSSDFPVVSSLYLGRLAWVADRASKAVTRYDARGRVTGLAGSWRSLGYQPQILDSATRPAGISEEQLRCCQSHHS